jgi:hypothetical protein
MSCQNDQCGGCYLWISGCISDVLSRVNRLSDGETSINKVLVTEECVN